MTPAIEFPPNNATVPGKMSDAEWPNPLAACPGYDLPIGTPVTLQMGAFVKVQLESYEIVDETAGHEIETCGFDASTYTQANGRGVLMNYGAVVIIPRKPLTPGHTYQVTVRTHRHVKTWNFRVRPSTNRRAPYDEASVQ